MHTKLDYVLEFEFKYLIIKVLLLVQLRFKNLIQFTEIVLIIYFIIQSFTAAAYIKCLHVEKIQRIRSLITYIVYQNGYAIYQVFETFLDFLY